jgi:glycine/D-amino acid oxidase-like deaminating enzyme
VTPDLFTKSIASLAEERGVHVTIATVDGIKFDKDDIKPSSVLATTDEGIEISIPCTDVLFAAGPWTATLAKKLLGKRASAALDIEPRFVIYILYFILDSQQYI